MENFKVLKIKDVPVLWWDTTQSFGFEVNFELRVSLIME